MMLWCQKLSTQFEQTDDLGRQSLGFLESFREENCLSDKLNIRSGHRYRSEELLEVIWQLRSTTITLSSRIHCHKDSSVLVDDNVSSEKRHLLVTFLDSILDDLDLL